MAKLNQDDIDSFNIFANLIKSNYDFHKMNQDEIIINMYKLLIKNDYTRHGAITTIHNTIMKKLDSAIEVRKTHIENITKRIV